MLVHCVLFIAALALFSKYLSLTKNATWRTNYCGFVFSRAERVDKETPVFMKTPPEGLPIVDCSRFCSTRGSCTKLIVYLECGETLQVQYEPEDDSKVESQPYTVLSTYEDV